MNLLFFVILSFSFDFHGSEASSGICDSHHNHEELVIESTTKKILDSLGLEAAPSVTSAQRLSVLEILENTENRKYIAL